MSVAKLVLVSNRIPVTIGIENGKLKGQPSSGGLVSALEPLLKDHGGIWVGSGARKTLHRSARSWKNRAAPILTSTLHSS